MNKIKILVFSMLLSLGLSSKAQFYRPIADTTENAVYTIFASDHDTALYYVTAKRWFGSISLFIINKLQGDTVIALDTLVAETKFTSSLRLVDAFFKDGRLLVFGPVVQETATNHRFRGAFSWDGNQFSTLSGQLADTATLYGRQGGALYNGDVLIAQHTSQHDNSGIRRLKNGSSQLDTVFEEIIGAYQVKALADTVYILGFTGSSDIAKIYIYVDDILNDSLGVSCDSSTLITIADNKLYYVDSSHYVSSYSNGIKTQYPNADWSECYLKHALEVHKGDLWMLSGNYLAQYGGGGYWDRIFNESYPDAWSFIAPKMDLISFNDKLYIAGVNNLDKHFMGEIEMRRTARVRGRCFYDFNGNCEYDAGERPIKGYMQATNTTSNLNYGAYSGNNGQYSLIIPADSSVIVKPFEMDHFAPISACGRDSLIISAVTLDSIYTFDVPYQGDTNKWDYAIDVSGGIARRGDMFHFVVTVRNNAYQNLIASNFTVNMDARIASPNLNTTFSALGFQESISYHYYKYIHPDSLNVGDTIYVRAGIGIVDSMFSNNRDTSYFVIQGPYDPNNKVAYPAGEIDPSVKKVNYTIQFQNIGNSYAKNVTVLDTISSKLPLKHIRVTGTSHPYHYNLKVKGNVLIWTFTDIYLPDSISEPEKSKGFITYEARLKDDLQRGVFVDNTAHIIFDYEEPITTNLARIYYGDGKDVIEPVNRGKLLFYPNPSESVITIYNPEREFELINILDYRGRMVKSLMANPRDKTVVNIMDLVPGIYFLKNEHGDFAKLIKL